MKLLLITVVLCILLAILCSQDLIRKPRGCFDCFLNRETRRRTTLPKNNAVDDAHKLGARPRHGTTKRRRTTNISSRNDPAQGDRAFPADVPNKRKRTTLPRNNEVDDGHHLGAGSRHGTTRRRRTTAISTNENAVDRTSFLPDEILLTIFDCLPIKDLQNACGVCRRWKDIVENKTLPERVEQLSEFHIPSDCPLTLQDFAKIYNVIAPQNNLWEHVYNKVLPGCPKGDHKDHHEYVPRNHGIPKCWKIFSVDQIIEVPNAVPKPDNYVKRSFVITNPMRWQVINLVKLGLPEYYIDTMQPKIELREWMRHSEYGFIDPTNFELKVNITLFSSNDEKKGIYHINFKNNDNFIGMWEEKILTLQNYGGGVRKIQFDREFGRHVRLGTDIFIPKPTIPARPRPGPH